MTKNKRPQGRPRSIIPKKNKETIKEVIENLFSMIASRHKVKRIENFLSEKFDVSVYAVRMWTTRGIPRDIRPAVAKLAGLPVHQVILMHERLMD
jgi:ribosomal protein L23